MKSNIKPNDDLILQPTYTMEAVWVDYNLMTTVKANIAGEANFSDHGANRLGASD